MVTLRLMKFGFFAVRLCLFLFRAIEDVLDAQHRDNRENLLGAPKVDASDKHLRQRRLHREVGHLASETGEQTLVIER